jgi:hypothetical protein
MTIYSGGKLQARQDLSFMEFEDIYILAESHLPWTLNLRFAMRQSTRECSHQNRNP